jgi:chemotaxis protein MotB
MPRLVFLALLALPLVAGCSSNRALMDQQAEEIALLRQDLDAAYAELERAKAAGANTADLEARLEAALAREQELRAQLGAGNANGERGETVAVLPTDIYFESGSAQLTPEGVTRMVDIARKLREMQRGRMVRVEGYTDDRPIGEALQKQYPSNWELSAARAAMVARHLQWTHGFPGSEVEIVGFSQYHPQASNDTPEGRQQNRRVRIALLD